MLACQALNQLAYFNDLFGIKADRRFVQDDNLRIVNNRLGNADALFVAA